MDASILDGLNPEQERAVRHPGGPLLILAGAGTGKTRTITRRVAWHVRVQGVPPGRILAITFTNKAARVMRARIAEWVPRTGIWVGTFHATCARMLRMDPAPVGRSAGFTILDEDDRRRLLKQLVKDAGWDPAVLKPRALGRILSGWKQRRIAPAGAAEEAALYGVSEERAAVLYARYEEKLAAQDSLDFDDLLLKGLQLVQQDAAGARRWAERFDHVLVDEYQDTNEVQYLFVRELSAARGNLSVCGDPDQSIYRWRGADIGNILRFEEDFPGAEVVRLERNYRSVGNVLRAAQEVIRHNRSRKEKDLVTEREDGPPLTFLEAGEEEAEAMLVASKVAGWIAGGTSAGEIAVFYRTNACSRALEAAFTRRKIPYQVVGGLSFFERREIKDLIAYGRTVVNPKDDLAVLRVINVPPRGIGATTLERLRAHAGEFDEPLLAALRRKAVREAFGSRARKALEKFLALHNRLGERVSSAEASLQTVLDRTGYRLFAQAMGDTEDVDRGENIDELLAFAAEYDSREGGGLRGFLEEIALLTDVDRWEEGAQRVSLMTIHTAKGLEFDRLAIVGLEEGLFPHARALEDPDGLEEERRLFYVALTRARLEICLTRARIRFRTGAPGPQAPSRFLEELPRELLEEGGGGRRGPAGRGGGKADSFVLEEPVGPTPFQVRDVVRHRNFGIGTVMQVLGRGLNQRLLVRFEDDGSERQLLLAYAPLEKIT